MTRTEEYRRRAEECRAMAAQAPIAEIRRHYEELARIWDQLADQPGDPNRKPQ